MSQLAWLAVACIVVAALVDLIDYHVKRK